MSGNVEDLLALLSELVAETLRNEEEQTTENLRLIADILEIITERILEFNVNVTESVSFQCELSTCHFILACLLNIFSRLHKM